MGHNVCYVSTDENCDRKKILAQICEELIYLLFTQEYVLLATAKPTYDLIDELR